MYAVRSGESYCAVLQNRSRWIQEHRYALAMIDNVRRHMFGLYEESNDVHVFEGIETVLLSGLRDLLLAVYNVSYSQVLAIVESHSNIFAVDKK